MGTNMMKISMADYPDTIFLNRRLKYTQNIHGQKKENNEINYALAIFAYQIPLVS